MVRACPIQTGATAARKIDLGEFDRSLSRCYERRGWDADGVPPAETEHAFDDAVWAE